MSRDKNLFESTEETPSQVIILGDGNNIKGFGIRTVDLRPSLGRTKLLTNVQFVPNLAYNLLCVGQLMSFGDKMEFSNGDCAIKDDQSKLN